MKYEEYENIKAELYKEFWDLNELDIKPSIRKIYEDSLTHKIENAKRFRFDYPYESTELLLNTFKSNFGIKLIFDMNDFFNSTQNGWDINKKIRFVKSIYENSYHYFFLISLCDIYDEKFKSNLYEYWYDPNKAKETPTKNEKNPWMHNDQIISGKYWILLNSQLFNNFPTDIGIIKDIKDYDSHEKLIITNTRILIVKKKQKPTIISIETFNDVIEHLLNLLKVTIHFYLKLIFECNFWVLPIIYLANSEKFNNNTIPVQLIDKEEKSKNKTDNILNEKTGKKLTTIFLLLYEYTNKRMWAIILEEKELINKFLEKDKMFLCETTLSESMNEVKNDNLKMISIVIKKIKQFSFNEDYTIVNDEKQIMNDLFLLIERIQKKEYKDIMMIFAFGLILAGYLILNPFAVLKNNLSKMIIKKKDET